MLYSGQYGKSLVSDDFNQMCTDLKVEVTIQAFPNPGNTNQAMRKITFQNYDKFTIKIIRDKKIDYIPAKGTAEIMLRGDEPLPTLERMEDV
jgi:hypothetical protein